MRSCTIAFLSFLAPILPWVYAVHYIQRTFGWLSRSEEVHLSRSWPDRTNSPFVGDRSTAHGPHVSACPCDASLFSPFMITVLCHVSSLVPSLLFWNDHLMWRPLRFPHSCWVSEFTVSWCYWAVRAAALRWASYMTLRCAHRSLPLLHWISPWAFTTVHNALHELYFLSLL